ncbi:MAG: phage tail tape measure C-terminal domain-containing protein [Defluviicoccus sp.]|nr:phage tail tape measure C-terminal domain-containing protein [Defluviicoccus sp.]MDG4610318.1 phage tail tape measure C-terminal domain-containing protein [Defluviicoccus sp.]
MADRSLAIRLAVVDGNKVKAELKDVGDAGSRSLKRIEDAARPASRALQAIDGVAGEVRGNLESMAGRLGPLGAGLSRIGPAGLAAAAAIAGVGLALKGGFEEAAEADRAWRRLEAVLKATGHASGLTATEIGAFSEAMEASTLVTAESVQDAASVLATFRSVSGDTFTRTLSLAQDLATVFGSDLASATTQLGKALEDPTQGLTALRRVGISFTESERELITALAETGRTADAQRLILDALEKQVGGAGAAEGAGLTGATNRLGDAWGNLLEAIGRTPAIASIAEGALGVLSSALEGLTGAFADDPIGARIDAAKTRLAQARDELARLQAGGPGTPMLGQRFALGEQRQRVAALEQELAALTRIGEEEAKTAEAEKARAEAGRKAAEAERLREALTSQRRDLDKALQQLATPPEKIAAVNRELAEMKKRLESLRAPDKSNGGEIDDAIHKAEELARRQIAALRAATEGKGPDLESARQRLQDYASKLVERAAAEGIDVKVTSLIRSRDEQQRLYDAWLARGKTGLPVAPPGKSKHEQGLAFDVAVQGGGSQQQWQRLGELGKSLGMRWGGDFSRADPVHFEIPTEAQAEHAEEAARRALEANREVIDRLTRDLTTFADERQQFIDQALSRLSEGATTEQRAEVERLAVSLYDEGEARKRVAEAMRLEDQLRQDGLGAIERERTARLKQVDELGLAESRAASLRAQINAAADRELAQAELWRLQQSRSWQDGLTRGLDEYFSQATDAAHNVEQVMGTAFRGMEDALVAFTTTGKFEFDAFAESLVADINRILIRMAIAGLIQTGASAFSGWYGASAGGSGQTGLKSGAGTDTLTMHRGGVVGHDPAPGRLADPALFLNAPRLHGGLAPDEFPAILRRGEGVFTSGQMAALGAGRGGVTVNVINNAGARVTTGERPDGRGGVTIEVLVDAVEQAMAARIARPGTTLNRALTQAANPIRAR